MRDTFIAALPNIPSQPMAQAAVSLGTDPYILSLTLFVIKSWRALGFSCCTMLFAQSTRVEAHIPRRQTALALPGLGIEHASVPLRSMNQLWVLLLQDRKVSLRLPVPDAVGGKHQIHLLQGALVGFWI